MKKRVYYADLGGQYSHLLMSILKKMDVVIVDNNQNADFVIISGSPRDSVDDLELLSIVEEASVPILGICYGAQLLAYNRGCTISTKSEYGPVNVELREDACFAGIPKHINVLMSHSNSIDEGIDGDIIAESKNGAAAFRFGKDVALLFHPEVNSTDYGQKMLENFLSSRVKQSDWNVFLEERRQEVKEIDDKFSIALSGGVDSSVALALMLKLDVDVHSFYVDMGIMPKSFRKKAESMGAVVLDGRKRLLDALSGVVDGKTKRRAIGKLFIDMFNEMHTGTLIQGTIASDVVESGENGKRATIKEHHNVGALPKGKIKLYEPLKSLYKDEVRELGRYLGLHEEIISTRPFPGPGFACRIVGEVTEEKLGILSEISEKVENVTKGLEIWQIPVVLLPVATTNVRGDKSISAPYVVVLRPVNSQDGMTATWSKNIMGVIDIISSELLKNEKIGRVLLEVDSKPPSTIEWM